MRGCRLSTWMARRRATSIEDRDAILKRLEDGRTLVVTNCNVIAEGFDQPSVKCAVLARPTKSLSLYLQQAGRILRPWNNHPAIILDHGGCALQHGLPQDEREYSLDTKKTRRSEKGDRGWASSTIHRGHERPIPVQYHCREYPVGCERRRD